jgi:hypothetical protein
MLINFGLDFGTSSCKVMFRDIIRGDAYACVFSNHLEDYGPFCWPSTICVHDGRLYFGTQAERMREGRKIRSFKICLACEDGLVNGHPCPVKSCLTDNDKPSLFALDSGMQLAASRPLTVCLQPWELASLYIAQLLNDIVPTVTNHASFEPSAKCTFNMSAPLDMVNEAKLKSVFERVLYAATLMKNEICQGIEITQAISVINRVKQTTKVLPPTESSRTFIVPETHAAMVGYVISGKAEPGLYAAIDVGAGTTDVSVFRYCEKNAARDVAYYAADTAIIGGDNIDKAILLAIPEIETLSLGDKIRKLALIRQAKSHFNSVSGLTVEDMSMSVETIESVTGEPIDRMCQHYTRTWGKSYVKEQRADSWRRLYILLLGGCTNMQLVRNRLLCENPSREFGHILQNRPCHQIELPGDIKVFGGKANHKVSEYATILTLAHGLSFHIAQNPDYFVPKEVPPLKRRNQTHVDPDDPANWHQ